MPSTKRVVLVENRRVDSLYTQTQSITEPLRTQEGLQTSEIR